ncbi:sulfurtransferase TusA family protein [Jiella sp. MQZ9-1]|uniref:Sulfurtransferase TusA family protein n=1 Tax=Jiella flava TaxID=2816857 RepID=A0A939G227_9HYPH|nr:sulfurtransferase TusA family protein [Jiella flava]MBO0663644.1 sulfurtransferase TusA family protein [Jiella flava]MCD2472219.1 sulfurtransferase TusA family protein [Jiella flava]
MIELDLRGLRCPLPALRTRASLAGLQPGMSIRVLADDPLAAVDIAHLCQSDGHCLKAVIQDAGVTRFEIVSKGA